MKFSNLAMVSFLFVSGFSAGCASVGDSSSDSLVTGRHTSGKADSFRESDFVPTPSCIAETNRVFEVLNDWSGGMPPGVVEGTEMIDRDSTRDETFDVLGQNAEVYSVEALPSVDGNTCDLNTLDPSGTEWESLVVFDGEATEDCTEAAKELTAVVEHARIEDVSFQSIRLVNAYSDYEDMLLNYVVPSQGPELQQIYVRGENLGGSGCWLYAFQTLELVLSDAECDSALRDVEFCASDLGLEECGNYEPEAIKTARACCDAGASPQRRCDEVFANGGTAVGQ